MRGTVADEPELESQNRPRAAAATHSIISDDRAKVWLAWLTLALVVAIGVALRAPSVHWLAGAADSPDFSFHPDDVRFVDGARDIKAPIIYGYPPGMTTQLYVLHGLTKRFMHVGLLPLLHSITIAYAALLILLTYATARMWRMSRGRALLAAAFFSVAPMSVVQSSFGTADVAAVFYFYATLLAAGEYLRTRSQLWFVIVCVLSGMSLAVKFFVPALVPLVLLLAVQHRGNRLAQTLTAAFVLAGSFETLCFFKYTPWDLHHLIWMLRDDNVLIAGTETAPLRQLRLYSWDAVSALGIPIAVLLVIGVVRWLSSVGGLVARIRGTFVYAGWRALITPESLFGVALSLHVLLIVTARIQAPRHLLVLLPVMCIAAANALFALFGLFSAGPRMALARALAIALILGFQTSEAASIEGLYATDVRNELAGWTARQAASGRPIVSMMGYSNVRGSTYRPDQNPLLLDRAADVVTCDLEYARYLHQRRAADVFHAIGGQSRLEFFSAVFEGSSDFGIVREFSSRPRGIELRLIEANVLPVLATYVPRRCFALGREGQLPQDAQRSIRTEVDATEDEGW